MKYCFILLLMLPITTQINAQKNITGVYYFTGEREMVSGFILKPDSTFEFFFSYGALDREGLGTWKILKDRIILNSRSKPATAFIADEDARKRV